VAQRMESILELAALGEGLHAPLKTYSSGMLNRLALSVAMHVDGDLFLLDEALGSGDFRFRNRILDTLKEKISQGAAAIVVSHDDTIRKLCSRAYVLQNGRFVFEGEAALAHSYYHTPSLHGQNAPLQEI